MAAKEQIFAEKSTETPPIEQTLNYFWMQFVVYCPKGYFKPLKLYIKNVRWRENPKWRPKHKKLNFAANWPIFNGFQKTFCLSY
jgi:hypothetical protein